MFPCQNRIWFVLALLEKYVSCLNHSYTEIFLLSNFHPLSYHCMCLCVQRLQKILRVWVCLWVYTLLCARGKMPQRKKGIDLCLYVSKETKWHHQCVIMRHWRAGVCRRMWHLTLQTGADCYPTSALTYICVCAHTLTLAVEIHCVCVITTHLFHIEALLHQRMLVESFASKTIWKSLFESFSVCLSWWCPRVGDSSQEALDSLWHKWVLWGRVRV